mmetsp:Transcript_15273/g.30418  ORF Transcript_15273/g.30418 Transcript_15273/m.30418 type:complete len:262 (-) Transcript_15273:8-793(-)
MHVVTVDALFQRCWDQDIYLLVQRFIPIFGFARAAAKAQQRTVFVAVGVERIHIKASVAECCAIVLTNGYNLATTQFTEELGSPESYVSETLDADSLAFQTLTSGFNKLAHAIVNTKTSCLGSPINTTLAQRLTCDTGRSVHVVLAVQNLVRILHPCHFSCTSTNIRGWHVNAWAEEALAGKLHGETTRDHLQFHRAVLARIDTDASLGTTKRYINHSTLEAHQAGQSFHFLQINTLGISDSALNWKTVMAMLSSVSMDDL